MNFSFLKLRRADFVSLLLIFAVSLLAALPLLRGDFFHFSDEPHIANLYQMVRAFESDQIPPRWAPDVSYEFGHPLFNFYYVLPFYLGSLIYFLTHSLIFSLKFVFLITIPLSGIFMYLWLKKHTDTWAAFLGSVVYMFTPYRAVDLYVRGAVGEALAFIFFPLVLLGIFRIFEKGRLRDIGVLGIITGLFLLSHNLAPLLFLPFAFFYGLALAISNKLFGKIWKVLAGLLLGIGIASYFVVPAFFEKNLLVSETPFNYQDHFPFIKQLIFSPFRYGASLPGPNDDLSFQVGIVNWILVVLGLVFLKKAIKGKRLIYILFVGFFFFFLFLMNIRSTFLWEAFSLSAYIQFPWRILMLTTFLTSSLVIFLAPLKKYRKVILGTLAVLAIVVNFPYFKPSEYFNPDDNYFLKRFFARRISSGVSEETSKQYPNYSEDYLLLPHWVKTRPKALPEAKFTSETLRIENIVQETGVDYSADVSGEGLLVFNSYYFPGWYATVDGKIKEITPLEPYGNMGIEVFSGEKRVRFFWKESPFRKTFDIVSLSSLVLSLALVVYKGKIKERA